MLNAVMSRPDDRFAERTLADACAMKVPPHVNFDDAASFVPDEDDSLVPVGSRLGVYFLADIVRNQHGLWWRVPPTHAAEMRLLLLMYSIRNRTDLECLMGAKGAAFVQRAANPTRTSNKKPITLAVEHVNPDAIVPLDLDLEANGVAIIRAQAIAGNDLQALSAAMEDDQEEFNDGRAIFIDEGSTPDNIVSHIVAQWAFDILQVSPNKKARSNSSYVTLTHAQLAIVTLDIYRNTIIPFEKVWVRARDQDYWKLQFDRFFPPKNAVATNRLQNFATCRYFMMLDRLMASVSTLHANMIRAAARILFRKFRWLPHTESDRMWQTRVPRPLAHWTTLGPVNGGAAPHIAINPLLGSVKDFALGNPYDIAAQPQQAPQNDEPEYEPDLEQRRPARAPVSGPALPLPPSPHRMPHSRDDVRPRPRGYPGPRHERSDSSEEEYGEFRPMPQADYDLGGFPSSPGARRATSSHAARLEGDEEDDASGEFQPMPFGFYDRSSSSDEDHRIRTFALMSW